ncbi:Fe-S cluster assembly scaffold protein NifU [Candidatus Micrarchaeota archaeon]|nr:MAG: Fe-S cluster assembly scaffold protein NifU [Candidatus Micrarchaeota archaeon]
MDAFRYSKKVLEHFRNPHNMGEIKDADGIGRVGNPVCGDVMYLYIKVKDNVITDVKFQTFGCVAAISSSSILTDMIKGMTIEEAEKLTKDDVLKKLDGLAPVKLHCSVLAVEALRKAIGDYRKRKNSERQRNC